MRHSSEAGKGTVTETPASNDTADRTEPELSDAETEEPDSDAVSSNLDTPDPLNPEFSS